MKKILLFLASAFSFSALLSQNVEFDKEHFPDKNALKEAKKNLDAADGYFNQSQNTPGFKLYGKALPLYLKADSFNSSNALLNYKIGVCYLHSAFKQKAVGYFEKAFKLNPKVTDDIHAYLGDAYHFNMEWEKAIKEYQKASQQLNRPEFKEQKARVDRKIVECKNGMDLIKNPLAVTIENAGKEINSAYSDYAPVISADESVIIFTSGRENTSGGGIDPRTQTSYLEDIYSSAGKDEKWSPAKDLGAPVNTMDDDASVALSADGQKLFVYMFDKRGHGDIFQCDQKGNAWDKPVRISEKINTPFHESSASLSADGNTLYFVSDMPGGSGGHDIYKSEWDKTKKEWGDPKNLGPIVNTPYEEYGVFIHPDGKTLYFSSEGHKSMGGFDIFKTVWNKAKKQWSVPENIGYPINSPDDDVNFVVSASGKHAYYSSFRADGFGEKDIYKISFKEEAAKSLSEVTILKGTISDAGTKAPLEADIEIVDNSENKVIATFTSNSATGKYLVSLSSGINYGIAVKKDGYLFYSENFDIPPATGYQEFTKDVLLNNISVGNKIVLKNIFFDSDKATLRPESAAELERLTKLLKDAPTLKIEISGHTDNKGSDDYNNKLSQSRSQAVVDYLASKGIDKSRLTAKGYGKTRPVASNDTEEGRQMNRRTEFEILSK